MGVMFYSVLFLFYVALCESIMSTTWTQTIQVQLQPSESWVHSMEKINMASALSPPFGSTNLELSELAPESSTGLCLASDSDFHRIFITCWETITNISSRGLLEWCGLSHHSNHLRIFQLAVEERVVESGFFLWPTHWWAWPRLFNLARGARIDGWVTTSYTRKWVVFPLLHSRNHNVLSFPEKVAFQCLCICSELQLSA